LLCPKEIYGAVGLTLERKLLSKCIILDLKEANNMIPKANAPQQLGNQIHAPKGHVGNMYYDTLIDENASQ
jgi:hypothetical protein